MRKMYVCMHGLELVKIGNITHNPFQEGKGHAYRVPPYARDAADHFPVGTLEPCSGDADALDCVSMGCLALADLAYIICPRDGSG